MSTVSAQLTKDTGWTAVPFAQVAKFVNGRAYKKAELLNEGTPVLRIQNLNGGDRWYYSNLQLPPDKYCDRGDLLFAWSASFGPYIWNGDKAIYHYHIWKVIPGPRLDKRFAFHLLGFLTQSIKDAAHGVAMLHITKGKMEAWEVFLPPLADQKRIAGILDAADALRAKGRESITQLDTLVESTFLDMFGDPVANPMKWDRKPLTEALELINGRAFKSSEWSDNGLPIIRIQNVKRPTESFNRFQGTYDEKHLVRDGDILLCWAGQLVSIGVHRWDREDGLLNQHIFKVIPRFDGEPTFVTYMLGFVIEQAKSNFRGIEMKHLTKADLARQQITIPPVDLQRRFAAIVESVARQKANQRAHLTELNALFASLKSLAFRGDL